MDPGNFSAAGREASWASLEEGVYDLLVIGGGITGCGVARDAAGRLIRVALVDQGDIGAGTSSRSSRLAHGGLRYLETYDFDLVFEALRERRRLLELAPHLVQPLAFLYPIFRGDRTGRLKLTAGMWLYEALSLFRSPQRHRMLGPKGVEEAEPKLRREGVLGGAIYYDAQVDDARLTLAVARSAVETGATLLTHARVEEISRGAGASKAWSVRISDSLGQREAWVQARVVLNATGPWSDAVRRLADPAVRPRLRTTKGVHVVVDRKRVGNRAAIILRSAVDGRVMFVLPWGDLTYIGTTDTEFSGDPGGAEAAEADVRYLLASANTIFPEARLEMEDVVSTWAGVRPLLAPDTGHHLTESETSREHAIWQDAAGLVNVAGGKLTTYRSMAAETTGFVASILEREFGIRSGPYYTEFLPLPGTPDGDWESARDGLVATAVSRGVPADTALAMVHRYGENLVAVLDLMSQDPSLGAPLIPGRPYLKAEVIHAVREELALTLEDVMRRRLHLFYEEPDGGVSVAADVAELMSGEEGIAWTPEERERQLASYAAAVEATRPGSVPGRS